MKIRLRRLWLTIHRWLGLVAGLLFVFLGLTGSLLVFDHAIDEWLNPGLLLTEGSGPQRSLAEAIASAEEAYADGAVPALALSAPRVTNGVWIVWFQGGTEDEPLFTQVYVNPHTGEVTGQRVWGDYLMSVVYKLHYTLLGGDAGETVVGVAGILLMISVASGIYLWWPLWKSGWRAAFAIRGGRRFNYDLHKVVGIIGAPILLVVAFTGVYMVFPEWIKPALTLFSEETKPLEGLESKASKSERILTPEEAIAAAQRLFPNARFDHFHPPQGTRGVYEVAFRQPDEVQKSFGRTQVWLDPHDGSVLAVRTPSDFTATDTFIAWQFPLHNGEAFGLVGRWIVFFSGLAPAVLYVTGLMLWLRRKLSQRRRRRPVAEQVSTQAAMAS